jgi:hypothetical protein
MISSSDSSGRYSHEPVSPPNGGKSSRAAFLRGPPADNSLQGSLAGITRAWHAIDRIGLSR